MILITEESFVQKISLQVVDLPVEYFLTFNFEEFFFSMNQPKAGKNVTIQKIVAQWLLCTSKCAVLSKVRLFCGISFITLLGRQPWNPFNRKGVFKKFDTSWRYFPCFRCKSYPRFT